MMEVFILFVGALLIVVVVTKVADLLLSGMKQRKMRYVAANVLSLALAVILGGYGFAESAEPVFIKAFSIYALPQVLVLVLGLYLIGRKADQLSPTEPFLEFEAVPFSDQDKIEPVFETSYPMATPLPTNIPSGVGDQSLVHELEPDVKMSSLAQSEPAKSSGYQRQYNFVARHWRGELSLPVSFWGIGAFVVILSSVIPLAFFPPLSITSLYHPYTYMAVIVGVAIIAVLLAVWQLVGVWRSARRYSTENRARGRKVYWGGVVQFLVLIGMLRFAASFGTTVLPLVVEGYDMAFLGDPSIPEFSLRTMRNGTEIELIGGFKYGLDEGLKQVLEESPQANVIHLDSGGGRIGEAIKVHRTIHDKGLVTYVSSKCLSACTIAFSAGKERWIGADAIIGFHSGSFPGMSSEDMEYANAEQRAILIRAGIDPTFVARALETPASSMMTPDSKELISAGVSTGIASTDKFAASGLGPSFGLDAAARLIRDISPAIKAIEERDPETAHEIFRNFHRDFLKGEAMATLVAGLHGSVASKVARYRAFADEATILLLGRLIIDEYSHLATIDTRLCYQYASGVNGEIDIGSFLTQELLQREYDIQERIVRTATNRFATDRTILDAGWEKVVATLTNGPHGKNLDLFSTTPRSEQYGDYCALAAAMYEAILQQPTPLAVALFRDLLSES